MTIAMLRLVAIATLLLACNGHKATPVGSGSAPATRPPLVVRETGVGPVDGQTKVTVDAIRPLFPGYDVKSAYPPGLDEKTNLGPPDVHVSADDELLMIILSNDVGTVLDVRVTSSKVTSDPGWRVGDQVTDPSRFAACECIADGLTCFAKSSQIGAVLDEDCMRNMEDAAMAGKSAADVYRGIAEGEPAALAKLKGRTVRMLRWKPHRFGEPSPDDPPPPPE